MLPLNALHTVQPITNHQSLGVPVPVVRHFRSTVQKQVPLLGINQPSPWLDGWLAGWLAGRLIVQAA